VRILNVNDGPNLPRRARDLLVSLVESDGAGLEQLSTDILMFLQENIVAILAAAPRLQVLNAVYVRGRSTPLLPVLRNGPLRVKDLRVWFEGVSEDGALAFAPAVAAHESLIGLSVDCVDFARGVNALVNAATERRLSRLEVNECVLDAEFIPALARLLQLGSLTKLEVFNCDWFHNAEESVPMLGAALRACTTLTHLKLGLIPFNGASHRTVTELLDAAAALPALSVLELLGGIDGVLDISAFGRALGALLRANLPSLRTLRVLTSLPGEEGLVPLLDGLAANTNLRQLNCDVDNDLSEAFKRDRLDPALAALAARAQLDA
jgi:hypothetical protein